LRPSAREVKALGEARHEARRDPRHQAPVEVSHGRHRQSRHHRRSGASS